MTLNGQTMFTYVFEGEAECVGTYPVITEIAEATRTDGRVVVRRATAAEIKSLIVVSGMAHSITCAIKEDRPVLAGAYVSA